MRWRVFVIVLILMNVALQAMDAWTTVHALQAGGAEGNPASKWIMDAFGLDGWLLLKIAFMAFLVVGVRWSWTATESDNRAATVTGSIIAVGMGAVIVNNVIVMGAF